MNEILSILLGIAGSGMSIETIYLQKRVVQLEDTLFLSLDILQTVVDRLNAKFGDEFFSGQAKINLSASSELAVGQVIDEIDDLVSKGQHGPAVKRFREEFRVTWDEAHARIGDWSRLTREQKVRVLRLGRWMHAISNSQAEHESATPTK